MSASFQQVMQEVRAENWDAARADLLTATQEHPNSAKAWYYLAQVDQHLGNVQEATMALNRADQIDPTHTYVGNTALYNQLRAQLATSNQTVLVKQQTDYSVTHPGEGSHPLVTGFIFLVVALVLAYILTRLFRNGAAKKAAAAAAEEAAAIKNRVDTKLDSYGDRRVPITSHVTSQSTSRRERVIVAPPPRRNVPPAYNQAPMSPPPSHTTVVNNSGSGDLLTGVLIGDMLANHGNHDTTVIHDREVVHDSSPSFDSGSSFDTGSSASSDSGSSFDWGSSASKSSSSFDSGSSSSSSYDYGSSSSSFDSGSSSSFDFGSSSSFDSGSSSDSSGW